MTLGARKMWPQISLFKIMFSIYSLDVMSAHATWRIDHIEKPPHETFRSYRGLHLKNGLRVLLISDSLTRNSFVSMSVGVGSFDDPATVPGLASLTSCLLLRGATPNRPQPDNFRKFLKRHEGVLYPLKVDVREHNFTFEVDRSALGIALGRFAQFFIYPISSSTYAVTHCIEDLHKKFEIQAESDMDLIFEIEKSLGRKNYAYNHHHLGSRQMFYEIAADSPETLIEKAKKFHDMWYSANLMSLVVLDAESLDKLESIVVPLFENIKNIDAQPMTFRFEHHPLRPAQLGHKIYVVPRNDLRLLRLIFPVPDDPTSAGYIIYFLNHEGMDALYSLVLKEGLCRTFAGKFLAAGGIAFFMITCTLNADSTEFHIDRIIHLIFQYLRLLNPNDLPRWIFEESSKIMHLLFVNSPPKHEDYSNFVRDIASNLQISSIEHALWPEIIRKECEPSRIREFLTYLKPDKMNVTIVGPQFDYVPPNEVEKIYGTSFALQKMSNELIQSYNTTEVTSELKFPQPHEFFPRNFKTLGISEDEPKYPHPRKLYSSSKLEIWFKQDDEFDIPCVRLEFEISCSSALLGPLEYAFWCVFSELLSNAIERRYRYYADLINTQLTVEFVEVGLHIKLHGYNDGMSILLEKILSIVTNFRDYDQDFNAQQFESARKGHFEAQKTGVTEGHTFLTKWQTMYLQEKAGWAVDTVVHLGSLLQYNQMRKFLSKVFRRVFVRGFIYGNYRTQDAMEVVEILEKSFRSSSGMLLQEIMLPQRLVEIPAGSNFVWKTSSKVKFYGYSAFFQLHQQPSAVKDVTAYLLYEIMAESCKSILRKAESQECSLVEKTEFRGLMIQLSSNEHPSEINKSVENFLRNTKDTLLTLSPFVLATFKELLQINKYGNRPRVITLADAYWTEIKSRLYNFDRVDIELKELSSLTVEQFLLYFQEMLGTPSQRRKLAVHVFPTEENSKKKKAPSSHATSSRINDITLFKNNSTFLPAFYLSHVVNQSTSIDRH